MSLKNILRGFAVYFVLVFVVSAVVSYVYGLVVHGQGAVDWESSVRLSVVFGIALPIVGEFERRKK